MPTWAGPATLLNPDGELIARGRASLESFQSGHHIDWRGTFHPEPGGPPHGFTSGDVLVRTPGGEARAIAMVNVRGGPGGWSETFVITGNDDPPPEIALSP